jgi:DNA-binding CsgD family transcriptional regulator
MLLQELAIHTRAAIADIRRVVYDLRPPALDDLGLVLALIAQGLTNSAIAEHLVLSQKTVRNYITEIFSKLQVADRAQAIIRARDAGLG